MSPRAIWASPSADIGNNQLSAVRYGHRVSDGLPSIVVHGGARKGSAGAISPCVPIIWCRSPCRLRAIGGGGMGWSCNAGATTASVASNMLSRAHVISVCPQRSMAWRIEPPSGTNSRSGSSCTGCVAVRRRISSSCGQHRKRLGGGGGAAAPSFPAPLGVGVGSAPSRSWSQSARVVMRSCGCSGALGGRRARIARICSRNGLIRCVICVKDPPA